MRKRFRGAFVLIPVVYAGVILLLLFLQFSDGQRFYESSDGLTIEGRMTPSVERDSSTIASVRVSYRGIVFAFGAEDSLQVDGPDGETVRLAPVSYTRAGSGFRIAFEQNASVAFELGDTERLELRVRPRLPEGLLPATAVTLPVAPDGGATMQETTLPGVFPVRFESEIYHLAPPPEARFDAETGRLQLLADGPTQTVRYVEADTAQQDVFTTWFSDDRLRIEDDDYENTVSAFIDDAYLGWTGSRFNGGSGTWDMRDASPVFSERILTATLAEAWRRNEYTAVFTDMRRAADQHPEQVSLLSAPYLGNLREIREQYLEADEERAERLLELARARDPQLFLTPGLARFARDRGGEALYEEVLAAAEEVEFLERSIPEALGMLRNYYLTDLPTTASREAFSRFASIIEARLLPNLYRAEEEGFFLRTAPGRVDVVQSLLAGRILEAAGTGRGNERLVAVGRRLVVSALGLADRNGFLPALLYVGDAGLEGAEGTIGPEAVYEFLSDNPAYPRQISLAEETGAGTWIWTVARFTEIDISGEAYRFTIVYPRNRTHYIVMQGVPPFSGMELFGQQWRNDPSFESYIKGRHYNRASQTLMIKYTDNSIEGDIILEY